MPLFPHTPDLPGDLRRHTAPVLQRGASAGARRKRYSFAFWESLVLLGVSPAEVAGLLPGYFEAEIAEEMTAARRRLGAGKGQTAPSRCWPPRVMRRGRK